MNKNLFIIFIASILFSNTTIASSEHDEKIKSFEAIIANDTTNAAAHFEYGEWLASCNEEAYCDRAIQLITRATQLEHNDNWIFSLGTLCCRFGRFHDALAAYQRILQARPDLVPVLYNSAYTLKMAGNLDLAIDICNQILTSQPNYEPARLCLSFSYLHKGDFENGWRAHEWNLKKQGKNAPELRELIRTNNIAGKTILLTPEGGIGDTINFVRYAQRLREMGAHVIVVVQTPLMNLFARCYYIDQLLSPNSSQPSYDARATLMSLPAILADTEETIPKNIPYIFPEPHRLVYWHKQLKHDTNIKIGICWQPDVHNDVSRMPIARRGIPLSLFYQLGSTPGITLYSLQKKEGLDQLNKLPAQVNLHVFDKSFDVDHGSFVDTAAVIHEMDLIISTDTATAHLAGAMGKKVWLLLPYATDWRWLHNRTDSAWYPTMRIFKQPHPFDWQSVMESVYETFIKEFQLKK